jgi:hypothetical protein
MKRYWWLVGAFFLIVFLIACGLFSIFNGSEEGETPSGSTTLASNKAVTRTLTDRPTSLPGTEATMGDSGTVVSLDVTSTGAITLVPESTQAAQQPVQVSSPTMVEPVTMAPTRTPVPTAPTRNPTATNALTNPTRTPSATSNTIVPTSSPTLVPSATAGSNSDIQIVGVELHRLTIQGGLDLVAQTDAQWVRRNGLLWSQVEPQEGARDWNSQAALEQELSNAASKGIEVMLIVRSTPAWAQLAPGYFCGPITDDKLEAFANFMYDAVKRYGAAPYNVKYWELGNEPDIDRSNIAPDSPFGCWGDKQDTSYYGGGDYAQMLKVVYPKIKAADPEAQVIIGGLLSDCDPTNPPETAPGSGQLKDCTPSRYLEGILENDGGDYFDGISFHAYDAYLGDTQYGNPNWNSNWNTTGPVFIAKARYFQNLLQSHGHGDKFIINSEAALICGRDGTEAPCQADDFHLTKAYYVAQVNASALAEGLKANLWYSLFGWRGSALVDGTLNPHPAFEAFQFSAAQLNGSSYSKPITSFSGVKGYEFSRGAKRVWFLWSLDGQDHQIQLSTMPGTVYDVFGNVIQTTQTPVVSLAPIYIEW